MEPAAPNLAAMSKTDTGMGSGDMDADLSGMSGGSTSGAGGGSK